MRKLIWWLIKDQFLSNQFKPVGFEQLELSFLDSNSKKLYKKFLFLTDNINISIIVYNLNKITRQSL